MGILLYIGTTGIGTCGVGTYGVGTCGIGTYRNVTMWVINTLSFLYSITVKLINFANSYTFLLILAVS